MPERSLRRRDAPLEGKRGDAVAVEECSLEQLVRPTSAGMCDEGSLPAEAERQGAGDVKWTKSLVAEVLKLAMASEREREIDIIKYTIYYNMF